MPIKVKVKKLHENAKIPSYKHRHDAGMDVSSMINCVIPTGGTRKIPTGISVELPDYAMIDVRSRSGLAINSQVIVLNAPGTIDSNYRGEIEVILINHGTCDFVIKEGDRIAQLVFMPFYSVELVEADELGDSERGDRGFGSTGIK